MDFLELGVAAQIIPSRIHTQSTLSIDPLGEGIDEDVELRRDGTRADDVRLSLPLPLTARLGIRYIHQVRDKELFDVELDVVYETWSRTERFQLNSNGLEAELLEQDVAIDVIDIEKEWRDTVGVRLGTDYVAVPDLLTVRGGLFYESAVADPSYAAIDFVSGRQLGAALGASVYIGDFEAALAYDYRRQPEIIVTEGEARSYQEVPGSLCEPPYTDPDNCHPQYLGQPAPAVNAGRYRAHSHVASLDLLYRF
jgi:hypothetical protein